MCYYGFNHNLSCVSDTTHTPHLHIHNNSHEFNSSSSNTYSISQTHIGHTHGIYYSVSPGVWKYWADYQTFWPISITIVLLPIYFVYSLVSIYRTFARFIGQCPAWLAVSTSLSVTMIIPKSTLCFIEYSRWRRFISHVIELILQVRSSFYNYLTLSITVKHIHYS